MKIKAIAVFQNKLKGHVTFEEIDNGILNVTLNVSGLSPGLHGFHIHESGNLLDKCKKCKGHFNPTNDVHGGLNTKHRHLGDFGNIEADKNGNCKVIFQDKYLSLRGRKYNIIGRSVIIHQDADNLGIPGDTESLTNGRSGVRLDCAVIGYHDSYYFN